MEIAPRWTPDTQTDPRLYADLRQLSKSLIRLGIECPSISTNHQEYAAVWFLFLTELSPLAFHEDLENARSLKKSDLFT